jgi:hypothetical protein
MRVLTEKNIKTGKDICKYGLLMIVMLVSGFFGLVELSTLHDLSGWKNLVCGLALTLSVIDVIAGCYVFAVLGARILTGRPCLNDCCCR